jgi:ankyrin repeat protein
MFQLLLDHGADFEKTNLSEDTPLCLAAKDGVADIVAILVARGANKEARDTMGGTPLWWAATKGHASVVSILLQNGASRDAKNKSGQSVFDVARRPDVRALLGKA